MWGEETRFLQFFLGPFFRLVPYLDNEEASGLEYSRTDGCVLLQFLL